MISGYRCFLGEGGRGGFLGGRGGVEDGAVPLCGHHGPRTAVFAGYHVAALCGQHCQLEGVQLHTSTQTQTDRRPRALKRFHFCSNAWRGLMQGDGWRLTVMSLPLLHRPTCCVVHVCHHDTCAAAPDLLLNWGCDEAIRSVVTRCSHTLSCLTYVSASLLFSRSVAFYSSGSQICHVDSQSCEAHILTGCSVSAVRPHREALGMFGFTFFPLFCLF